MLEIMLASIAPCTLPLGAYGASKLAGEHLVAAAGGSSLILRTSAVYGLGANKQKGGSFPERIIAKARAGERLRVVSDQVFSPTYSADLADAAIALARSGARGLFHVSGGDSCSWHAFAVAALRAVDRLDEGACNGVVSIWDDEGHLPRDRVGHSLSPFPAVTRRVKRHPAGRTQRSACGSSLGFR